MFSLSGKFAPSASSMYGSLPEDDDDDDAGCEYRVGDDEDGIVSLLLNMAMSIGGAITTVVSSLLPCGGLPLPEVCDRGGLVHVLLSRAVCHGMILILPLAEDGAGGGQLPFLLSLGVHLGLILRVGHTFLLFSGLM